MKNNDVCVLEEKSITSKAKSLLRIKIALLVLFLCTVQMVSQAANGLSITDGATTANQQKVVSGKVTDSSGVSLPGVSVVIKGTTTGTITDANGSFSLSNVSDKAVLQFSFVGMKTMEIAVAGKTNISVKLEDETIGLEEVVAVGYGVQKKVNLTGSVSSVDLGSLTESRPITNVTTGLAGLVSGVNITSGNNAPSNNGDVDIKVRGQGTLNNSSPLVIIDGVEGSMNSVSPQDVASVSVLKDAASSAIYGSRAANGVILITTKTGKSGKMKLDYSGYVSFQTLNKPYEVVSNYANYMTYLNEGMANSKKTKPFSDKVIELWRSHENDPNPYAYANSDIFDVYETGVSQQHSLSVSGGSKDIAYYTSFNYLNNPGILENCGYERFSLRSNLDSQVRDWLKIGVNLSGYSATTNPVSENINDIYTYGLSGGNPGIAYKDDQNRLGTNPNNEDDPQNAANNPYVRLRNVSGEIRMNTLKSRMYAILTPLKGLTVQGSYTYDYFDKIKDSKPNFVPLWNFQTNTIYTDGVGQTSIYNYNEKTFRDFMDATARYEIDLFNNRLSTSILAGASQEQYRRKYFSATRKDLMDPSLGVIDGAVGESSSTGNSTEWAMRSFFGRVNLGWDNKYLIEVNLRADASSRFLGSNRWGYFPSFSAAWRASEEGFMKDLNLSWLDNLKLRASYGSLGNNSLGSNKDNDGNYTALSLYSQTNYVLGRMVAMGLSQTAIANPALTWETTYVTNFGMDFNVLGNRLSGTIDGFEKKTEGILIDLPAPMVHGNATIPKQNAAVVSNKGLEVSFDWNDKVGTTGISYNVGVNFTYIKNTVKKFRGDVPSYSGARMLKEGLPINVLYVRVVDRLVQTDEDLAVVQNMLANPSLPAGKVVFPYGIPEKGDLLYKDLNNDGLVNDEDRMVIGAGRNPKYTYGITLGAKWKGIDFSTLIQGVGGIKDVYLSQLYKTGVRLGYQLNKDIIDGRWYEGRTDAKYPRLLEYTNTKNEQYSDFWVADKSYLKIRNIQLGYTLPSAWAKAASFDKVRFYGSLENFFTFTKWKGYDPEVDGITYPTMRQAVFGLNISF